MSRGSANISPSAVPFLLSDAQDGARLKPGAWTFFGFIVVKPALFVRPGALVPAVLGWPIYAVVVTTIALLQYHGVIDLPGLSEIAQGHVDSETGEVSVLLRLVSTGIFNDPNDLSLLLILASGACVYSFGDRRWGAWRWIWLTP